MVQRRTTRRRMTKYGGDEVPPPAGAATPDPSGNLVPPPAPATTPDPSGNMTMTSPMTMDPSGNMTPPIQPVVDPSAALIYVYRSQQISTQSNADPEYKEVGIIHVSDSAPINAARGLVTGVANFFGSKGMDNSVFDFARNDALEMLQTLLSPHQKVCNLRMEMTKDETLVFVHMYGTLLETDNGKDMDMNMSDS